MNTNNLFEEIKGFDKDVASALEKEEFITDEQLRSLSQEDLRELLPRVNIKRRKCTYDIIHKQKPSDVLIQKLKGFISHEHLSAALSTNEALVDYINVLKDLKSQMNTVQDFLDAHIKLLEKFSQSQPLQDQDKDSSSYTSRASGSMKRQNSQTSQTSHSSQIAGGRGSSSRLSRTSTASNCGHPQKTRVTFKMVVSGVTFDAHLQLLDKLKASNGEPDLILHEQEDCQVVFVFCPVVSRIGTDAEAALNKVTGPEPVILVLMHHTHAVKPVPSARTWDTSRDVVLCVRVFYHETVPGLLQCQENNIAIAEIQKKLMTRSVTITENTSGKPEMGASLGNFVSIVTNFIQSKN